MGTWGPMYSWGSREGAPDPYDGHVRCTVPIMRFVPALARASGMTVIVLVSQLSACDRGLDRPGRGSSTTAAEPATGAPREGEPAPRAPEAGHAAMAKERQVLVNAIRDHGVSDPRILDAVARVPRHELVPRSLRQVAYDDRPLPIGEGQTISQPSLVALMTELAKVDPGDRVLEVGTGSGYQAALLAELTDQVYTIEIVEPLAKRARSDLERLGYGGRIQFRIGDGYAGWPEAAPFDAIIVTAAPPTVPEPLKQQLKVGGRLVIPVGKQNQELEVIERTKEGFTKRRSVPVRFVPMTGQAQE